MLRTPALRSTLRTLTAPPPQLLRPTSRVSALDTTKLTSRLCTLSFKRPQVHSITAQKLNTTTYIRQQATKKTVDKINSKLEDIQGKVKLDSDPQHVTTTSSVHPVFSEIGVPNPEPEVDMGAGLKADLKTIVDTFDLSEVPRQAYILGFAGVIPYIATSLSTLGCAFEINHAKTHGFGYLMSQDAATQILHILEPIQIGYGAVLISFLGAIHWGLEWANYGGHIGYPRYAIGVMAPAIAWPTTLLPLEYALITQFLAFSALYYADARACKRGWAPPWYGTYRFVLTFFVGAAIVLSLIGRGEIGDEIRSRPQGTLDRVKALRMQMPEELAKEEDARRARLARESEAAEEEGGEEEEGEDEEGGDGEKEEKK